MKEDPRDRCTLLSFAALVQDGSTAVFAMLDAVALLSHLLRFPHTQPRVRSPGLLSR
jgi:hypothetical protein